MVYYFDNKSQGIIIASSHGDGYNIDLKWHKAFPTNKTNSIAYQIYMATAEIDLFSEGVKFVSIDGSLSTTIEGLTPGQLYFFAVRAVEYSPVLFDINNLQRAFNNLVVYPQSLLITNITASSNLIPVLDTTTFPNYGVVQIGYEMINYSSVNNVANTLNLTNATTQRGFFNTVDSFHDTDGYDGYNTIFPAYVTYTFGREELNKSISSEACRFEYPYYPYDQANGFKQVTNDYLTTNLTVSDSINENFPTYDYAGYHRTNPVELLNGTCVGSYIGGEMGCADGYGGVGMMVRGLSVQNQNTQRQDILLNLTGESVVLLQRQTTGIICSCYTSDQEYADDRCPYCFAEGTLVRTEKGLLPIETIQVGDKVLSSDGKFHLVKQVFKNPYNGLLKSITTATTTNPILSTPDHPFLMLRNNHKEHHTCSLYSNCKNYVARGDGIKYRCPEHNLPGHTLEWDSASKLEKKSWLNCKWATEVVDVEKIEIPQEFRKNTHLGSQRNGSNEFIVDEEFLWMIGLYLAEGSKNKRNISFALHQKEQDYKDRVVSLFAKYGYTSSTFCNSENGMQIEIYGSSLAKWFPVLCGNGCQNKKIPEQFMKLPDDKLKALIQGIFDGDGCRRDREIALTSEILVLQCAEILHRLGEKPLVRHYQNNILTEKGNKRKKCYYVNWQNDDDVDINRKGRWAFHEQLLSQVKKVEDVQYDGYVYNLEVEGDSTYVVQNILVHNCYGTKLVVGYTQYFNPRRADGMILVRFGPGDDDLIPYDSGLESTFTVDCWTLTVPTVKDRDIIIRYDEGGNEEFRYEILYVNRNKMLLDMQGVQKFRVQRIRKFDIAYQIRAFPFTQFFPQSFQTGLSNAVPGLPPHSHSLVINENVTSVSQINQTTGVTLGHNHPVYNGTIGTDILGHTHLIVLPVAGAPSPNVPIVTPTTTPTTTTTPPALGPGDIDSYGTISSTYNAPAGVQIGQLVYITSAGDTVALADCGSMGAHAAIGYIVENPTSTSVVIQYDGELGGFTGLVPGALYYLSTTPGAFSITAPVLSNFIVQNVGIAKDATTMIIKIDTNYTLL